MVIESQITTIEFNINGRPGSFTTFIPQDYLVEIGMAMTEWSLFEHAFNNFICMIHWNPATAWKKDNLPGSFPRRLKLLLAATKVALPDCPEFYLYLQSLCNDAEYLSIKRNHLTHCTWFQHEGMTIYQTIDNSKPCFSVAPGDAAYIAAEIHKVWSRLMTLQLCYFNEDVCGIPAIEAHLWKAHVEAFRPKQQYAQPTPKPRPAEPFIP